MLGICIRKGAHPWTFCRGTGVYGQILHRELEMAAPDIRHSARNNRTGGARSTRVRYAAISSVPSTHLS
ncbi:hypothetical protein HYPDE_31548 [Hyphomicrobium denitrificans 1NES1]|uniref:Uncharacterized protein n=1 Tax=Hyphomicrobium denitrificans 1NES1 TaxID=670307 RepID=N0B3A5_9HYPH|nr:hypothetical protein HYPDE_31548 [Hyphomicrobium denitrificans 1NES1]